MPQGGKANPGFIGAQFTEDQAAIIKSLAELGGVSVAEQMRRLVALGIASLMATAVPAQPHQD